MSVDSPSRFQSGQIVLADWRGDAVPPEPTKIRPAVVVEDDELFLTSHGAVILVPLTGDPSLAVQELTVCLEPTADNGCTKQCWVLSYAVSSTAKSRVRLTASSITPAQLSMIRRQIGMAIGIET